MQIASASAQLLCLHSLVGNSSGGGGAVTASGGGRAACKQNIPRYMLGTCACAGTDRAGLLQEGSSTGLMQVPSVRLKPSRQRVQVRVAGSHALHSEGHSAHSTVLRACSKAQTLEMQQHTSPAGLRFGICASCRQLAVHTAPNLARLPQAGGSWHRPDYHGKAAPEGSSRRAPCVPGRTRLR